MKKKIGKYVIYFLIIFVGFYVFIEDRNLYKSLIIATIFTIVSIFLDIVFSKKSV